MPSPELIAACRELRKTQTKAEAILWSRLRNRQLNGYKFRRQHPVAGFILDFFCPEASLAIEVDGEIHKDKETKEYDLERSRILAENGIRVLRFWNFEVETETEKVLVLIAKAVDDSSLKL